MLPQSGIHSTILTSTNQKKYREELLDGSHLTTPGIQVLHPYYPLLTYLHYNTNEIHPGYHCFTALLITYCQLTSPHTTKELNSIPETIIQPTLFCLKHPLIAVSTVFIQELSEIGITCQLISLNQGTWKNLLIYLTNYS